MTHNQPNDASAKPGRPQDSPWAFDVAQVASRTGQSQDVDTSFPAPSGIGDNIVGVDEGSPVAINGSFDSIVDGLIFNGTFSAPVHAECTRCLNPIQRDWSVNVTTFFPYESAEEQGKHSKNSKQSEVDIIAEEDESADVYPLAAGGTIADFEALLRDTLVENLPLQVLCRPDCKGLCPKCGVNLNDNPDHGHDEIDDRFSALAGLKSSLEAKQETAGK